MAKTNASRKLDATRIELYPLSELRPYEKNPRKNDAAVQYVKESIAQFGFKVPIVIDSNRVIVCGHTRYKAAKSLGLSEVPCIVADDLTEDQIQAFRLADNKVAEFAEWDDSLLGFELGDLDACCDIDMTLFGFDELKPVETPVEEDEIPEDADPVVKPGELWRLGEHLLLCGDSTDPATYANLLDGEKADLVFTDPPYGMKKENEGIANDNLNFEELLEFNKQWIPLTFQHLKENGSWYCWGIDEPLMDIYANLLKPMQKRNEITFRNLITRTKGAERAECGGHATPKPLALCARAIKSSSRPGEVVLDVFGGSGSTLIACEQLNRKCRMIELDPHYCDVMIARWEKATGNKAEKVGGEQHGEN